MTAPYRVIVRNARTIVILCTTEAAAEKVAAEYCADVWTECEVVKVVRIFARNHDGVVAPVKNHGDVESW